MTDNDLITERVVQTAERLEDADDELGEPTEDEARSTAPRKTVRSLLDPLDVEYTVSSRGDVKEVTAILGTGGPHIEVDCHSGIVRGSWGNDTHTTHVRSEVVEQFGEMMARHFEENMVA